MRGGLERAVRGADPRSFAMVMATGIVSVALGQAGARVLSVALLWVAAVAFAVLVVASGRRAAAFGRDVRADLRRPDRVFSYFAFPAAASVVAARLADSGPAGVVVGLAVVAALAWIAVACAVAGFVARVRPAVASVSGAWELGVVGTQAAAIAATSAYAAGVVPARLAAWAAIAAWSAGAALYPVITVLVITRLLTVGLGPGDLIAPYWVTMGAASITVLGAAQILPVARAAAVAAVRPALTGLALIFWSVATGLIPALVVLAAARWRRPRRGFRRELWMIVFPVGMYAAASMRLGAAAGLPVIRDTGTAATWVAAAVWAVVFTWMIAWPIIGRCAHPATRAPLPRWIRVMRWIVGAPVPSINREARINHDNRSGCSGWRYSRHVVVATVLLLP